MSNPGSAKFLKSDGGRKASGLHNDLDNGDCGPRALSHLNGGGAKSFKDALRDLSLHNFDQGHMNHADSGSFGMDSFLQDNGFRKMSCGKGWSLAAAADALGSHRSALALCHNPDNPSQRHAAALMNGKLLDSWDSSSWQCDSLWSRGR